MATTDFIAQKVGNCDPDITRFPKRIAQSRYNMYGNAMCSMLKPFVNGLYGMMDNTIFIASQNCDLTMNVVQGLVWYDATPMPKCKNEGWQTSERKDIVAFIIQNFLCNKIVLRKWHAPQKSKTESEMKEQRVYAHLQTNSDSVIRKGKGCVKHAHKWQAKMSEKRGENAYEYQVYNRVHYGSFSGKQSSFIEGSGICAHYFDNSDHRPPMPQFPEKCRKPVKR